MKKRYFKTYELLKDIVIPKGTIFETEMADMKNYDGYISTEINITKNSNGEIAYSLCNDSEELKKHFKLLGKKEWVKG